MARFNVGVGDAFPADVSEGSRDRASHGVESAPRPVDDDFDADEAELARRYRKRRHGRSSLLSAVVILLGIYGALSLFAHHGPRGLLLAAAIVFAVWVAKTLFGGAEAREERRAWLAIQRRRDERRRARG